MSTCVLTLSAFLGEEKLLKIWNSFSSIYLMHAKALIFKKIQSFEGKKSKRIKKTFLSDTCSCYAWFNSTCYHAPPGHTPGDLQFWFSFGGLFPTPGHAERDNSPPPGLLIDHKYVVLCTNRSHNRLWLLVQSINYNIDFRTIAKPDVLIRT